MAEARSAQPPGPPNWVREPWINTERRFADTLPEVGTKNHAETNRRYSEETADLKRWWVSRMLSGEAPLRAVMTPFWHGHFATAVGKVLVSQAMYVQNATLRR